MSEPPEDAEHPSDELRGVVRAMMEVRGDLYRASRLNDEAERVLVLVLPQLEPGSELAHEVAQLIQKLWTDRRNSAASAEKPVPDGPMTPEQEKAVAQLSVEYVASVDEAIIAFLRTTPHWRKVARVVGEVMRGALDRPGVPDVFYSSRVQALVAAGVLESKGDLRCMRFSEVRLASDTRE